MSLEEAYDENMSELFWIDALPQSLVSQQNWHNFPIAPRRATAIAIPASREDPLCLKGLKTQDQKKIRFNSGHLRGKWRKKRLLFTDVGLWYGMMKNKEKCNEMQARGPKYLPLHAHTKHFATHNDVKRC